MSAIVAKYGRNDLGRDFVVGDIHGMFSLLDEKLCAIGFDKSVDRLFSTGDLVDRGPESHRVLEYLGQPWFIPVLGNHDQMVIDCVRDGADPMLWMINGGAWIHGVSEQDRRSIVEAYEEVPVAIEVDTANGPVGIVHADMPCGMEWADFCNRLSDSEDMRYLAMWCRGRLEMMDDTPVSGLWRLYLGHTINMTPIRLANVVGIDTGAFLSATDARFTLTVMEITAP